MQTPPLAPFIHLVNPDESYTVADLARLTGRAPSTVGKWGRGGWLGEGSKEESDSIVPGGAYRWTWPGHVLIAATENPPADDVDHTHLMPSTTWGYGCRHREPCDCLSEHNASSRESRARRRADRFPPERQRAFLARVSARTPLQRAAQDSGVTLSVVYGLAAVDQDFRTKFEQAREALCALRWHEHAKSAQDAALCGTPGTARTHACQGLACYRTRVHQRQNPLGQGTRAKATDRAKALGYPSVEDYLRASRSITRLSVAAALGVSVQTVTRWRRELENPSSATSET